MSYEQFGASSQSASFTGATQVTTPVTVRDGAVLVTRTGAGVGTVVVEVRARHPTGFWQNETDGWAVLSASIAIDASFVATLPCESQVRARCSVHTSNPIVVTVAA